MFLIIFLTFFIKNQFGVNWLKIFYHYSGNGDYFLNFNEALNISSPNKYSILLFIDDKYKINNKFEFLLEYPEFNNYNRWKQSKHPLNNLDNDQLVEGYEPIYIGFNSGWVGLVKSSDSRTVIDGHAGGYWYYSIGTQIGGWTNNQFPGPPPNSNSVKNCSLWLRIDNIKSKYLKKNSIHFYLLLINILFFYLLYKFQ